MKKKKLQKESFVVTVLGSIHAIAEYSLSINWSLRVFNAVAKRSRWIVKPQRLIYTFWEEKVVGGAIVTTIWLPGH